MRNSATLYRIEKMPLNRLKRIYSDKLYTLESNSGNYASVYVDNEQVVKYTGEGAWAYAQRTASALALNLDMGDL
ncbi:MAG: hypothetical protein ACO295_03310 [Sediminibacterium sp.]